MLLFDSAVGSKAVVVASASDAAVEEVLARADGVAEAVVVVSKMAPSMLVMAANRILDETDSSDEDSLATEAADAAVAFERADAVESDAESLLVAVDVELAAAEEGEEGEAVMVVDDEIVASTEVALDTPVGRLDDPVDVVALRVSGTTVRAVVVEFDTSS